jgi:formylmethanofuran dehydrogenase subunit E
MIYSQNRLWELQYKDSDKYAVKDFDRLPFDIKWNRAIGSEILSLKKLGKKDEAEMVFREEQERVMRVNRTKESLIALQEAIKEIERRHIKEKEQKNGITE